MRSAVIHAPADQEMGAADFAAGRPTPDAEAYAGLVCAALRAMNRALEDAGLDRQMKSEVLGDVGACLSCPWWCSEAAGRPWEWDSPGAFPALSLLARFKELQWE